MKYYWNVKCLFSFLIYFKRQFIFVNGIVKNSVVLLNFSVKTSTIYIYIYIYIYTRPLTLKHFEKLHTPTLIKEYSNF